MILRHCGRIRPSRSQQSPGEGIGNGRATVLRFAQEGAKILAVDRDLVSAEETAVLAAESGGECVAVQADVTREATLAAAMAHATDTSARQRSARPSRRGASDCSAADAAGVAVARSRVQTSAPNTGRFRRRCRARARRKINSVSRRVGSFQTNLKR